MDKPFFRLLLPQRFSGLLPETDIYCSALTEAIDGQKYTWYCLLFEQYILRLLARRLMFTTNAIDGQQSLV